jgi:hypothetical protein
MVIHEKWVFPFIGWYADHAHCYNPLGYSGLLLLWYFIFVGIPLVCALLVGFFSFPTGLKGLIDKQFPPKGVKVYKPTKIIRGNKAKFKSIGHVLVPFIFIAIGVWGIFQVDQMPIENPDKLDFSVCQS